MLLHRGHRPVVRQERGERILTEESLDDSFPLSPQVRWQFNDSTRDRKLTATVLSVLPRNTMGPLYLVQLLDETNPEPFDIGATVLTVAAAKSSQSQVSDTMLHNNMIHSCLPPSLPPQTRTLKYRDYRYKDQPPVIQMVTPSSTSTPSLLPSSRPREEPEVPPAIVDVHKTTSQPILSSPPVASEAEEGRGPGQEPGAQGTDVSSDLGKVVDGTPKEAVQEVLEATRPKNVSAEGVASDIRVTVAEEVGADLPVTGFSPGQSEGAKTDSDERDSTCPSSPPPDSIMATTTDEGEAIQTAQEAVQLQPEATQVKPTTAVQPLPSAAGEKPRAKVKPLKIETSDEHAVAKEEPLDHPAGGTDGTL